jgi:NAD-dependent DNA ligase
MALTELQQAITDDQTEMECQMGTPTFVWQSNTYPLIASVASFKRDLDSGGFATVLMMTATVRIYNCDGTKQFTTIPQPQQKITYNIDGHVYRIDSVRVDPTGSYFRIIAECPFKGI